MDVFVIAIVVIVVNVGVTIINNRAMTSARYSSLLSEIVINLFVIKIRNVREISSVSAHCDKHSLTNN